MKSPQPRQLLVLLVLLAGFGPVPTSTAATVRPLGEVLRNTPHGRLLELRFDNDEFVRGYPVVVRNDTIYLQQAENQGPLTPYSLPAVVGVREWRSNGGRGAAWGATSGALVVGSFGLLMGSYLASTNSDYESDTGPVIGATLLGAGIGALGGSVLGLGVGSLSHSWREIWPSPAPVTEFNPTANSEATRLGLFAGSARPILDGYEVSRFAARVSLRKSLGRLVSLGPEISFHDFEGEAVTGTNGGSTRRSKENLIKLGLALNLRSQRPGLSPYATTGIGWLLSNDSYLGGHLGGGLRWQFNRGNDFQLDVRYHFNITTVNPGEVDQFWTLGVGLGFDL